MIDSFFASNFQSNFVSNSGCPIKISQKSYVSESREEELLCHENPVLMTLRHSDACSSDQISTETPKTAKRDSQETPTRWKNFVSLQRKHSCKDNIGIPIGNIEGNTLNYHFDDFLTFESPESLKSFNKSNTSLEENSILNDDSESKILENWSEDQDKILLELARQLNYRWKVVAEKFQNKNITPKFVKIRYQKLTERKLQLRTKFHPIEDLMIAKYFKKYGSNWNVMATHFENRTPIMLKNRYYSFIRKRNLLPFLIQKVRELESRNLELGNAKNQGDQDCLNLLQQNPNYWDHEEEISLNFIDYRANNQDEKYSISCFSDHSPQNGTLEMKGHFNYFETPIRRQTMVDDETEKNEIKDLKSQINTLKLLLFEMKSEIFYLKARKNKTASSCLRKTKLVNLDMVELRTFQDLILSNLTTKDCEW